MCKYKSRVREINLKRWLSDRPSRHKNTDKSFCVALDIAAAALLADKAFNADDLGDRAVACTGASSVVLPPENTARFDTTSITKTIRQPPREFLPQPHDAIATASDDLQAIIREEVSRVG
jgi:hypothetical protein